MGTLNFTVVGRYARGDGYGTPSIPTTAVVTSGAYSTTTSATNVEDGSGDISLAPGNIFRATASEPMWIAFGSTAAVGTGFYIGTDQTLEWECSVADAGVVSAIDVS